MDLVRPSDVLAQPSRTPTTIHPLRRNGQKRKNGLRLPYDAIKSPRVKVNPLTLNPNPPMEESPVEELLYTDAERFRYSDALTLILIEVEPEFDPGHIANHLNPLYKSTFASLFKVDKASMLASLVNQDASVASLLYDKGSVILQSIAKVQHGLEVTEEMVVNFIMDYSTDVASGITSGLQGVQALISMADGLRRLIPTWVHPVLIVIILLGVLGLNAGVMSYPLLLFRGILRCIKKLGADSRIHGNQLLTWIASSTNAVTARVEHPVGVGPSATGQMQKLLRASTIARFCGNKKFEVWLRKVKNPIFGVYTFNQMVGLLARTNFTIKLTRTEAGIRLELTLLVGKASERIKTTEYTTQGFAELEVHDWTNGDSTDMQARMQSCAAHGTVLRGMNAISLPAPGYVPTRMEYVIAGLVLESWLQLTSDASEAQVLAMIKAAMPTTPDRSFRGMSILTDPFNLVGRCERRAAVDYPDLLDGQLNPADGVIARLCGFDRYYVFAIVVQLVLAPFALSVALILAPQLHTLYGSVYYLLLGTAEELTILGGADRLHRSVKVATIDLGRRYAYAALIDRLIAKMGLLQKLRSFLRGLVFGTIDCVRLAHALRTTFRGAVDALVVELEITMPESQPSDQFTRELRILGAAPALPVLDMPTLRAIARGRLGKGVPIPRTRQGLLALLASSAVADATSLGALSLPVLEEMARVRAGSGVPIPRTHTELVELLSRPFPSTGAPPGPRVGPVHLAPAQPQPTPPRAHDLPSPVSRATPCSAYCVIWASPRQRPASPGSSSWSGPRRGSSQSTFARSATTRSRSYPPMTCDSSWLTLPCRRIPPTRSRTS